jgi:hypothetical protein
VIGWICAGILLVMIPFTSVENAAVAVFSFAIGAWCGIQLFRRLTRQAVSRALHNHGDETPPLIWVSIHQGDNEEHFRVHSELRADLPKDVQVRLGVLLARHAQEVSGAEKMTTEREPPDVSRLN